MICKRPYLILPYDKLLQQLNLWNIADYFARLLLQSSDALNHFFLVFLTLNRYRSNKNSLFLRGFYPCPINLFLRQPYEELGHIRHTAETITMLTRCPYTGCDPFRGPLTQPLSLLWITEQDLPIIYCQPICGFVSDTLLPRIPQILTSSLRK